MRRTRVGPRSAGLILLGLVIAACGGATSTSGGGAVTSINLGVPIPLTGALASVAPATIGSIKVAVADVNAGGGFTVAGKRYVFNVVPVDDASTTPGASAAATTLIRDDHVKFVVGAPNGPEAVGVQLQTSTAHVIFISSAAALADSLQANGPNTTLNRYYFSSFLTANGTQNFMVDGFMKAYPNTTTAAILFPNFASFDSSVNAEQARFASHGVTVAPVVRYDITTNDFTPLLTRIKPTHPDVLVSCCSLSASNTIAKQWVDVGDVGKAWFEIGAGASTAISGATGKPLPFPMVYFAQSGVDVYANAPAIKKFYDEYPTVNGTPAPPGAGSFHDAIIAMVKGMQKAGTVSDVDRISKAMAGITVQGLAGPFGWNARHLPHLTGVVCTVVAGKVNCGFTPLQS